MLGVGIGHAGHWCWLRLVDQRLRFSRQETVRLGLAAATGLSRIHYRLYLYRDARFCRAGTNLDQGGNRLGIPGLFLSRSSLARGRGDDVFAGSLSLRLPAVAGRISRTIGMRARSESNPGMLGVVEFLPGRAATGAPCDRGGPYRWL